MIEPEVKEAMDNVKVFFKMTFATAIKITGVSRKDVLDDKTDWEALKQDNNAELLNWYLGVLEDVAVAYKKLPTIKDKAIIKNIYVLGDNNDRIAALTSTSRISYYRKDKPAAAFKFAKFFKKGELLPGGEAIVKEAK